MDNKITRHVRERGLAFIVEAGGRRLPVARALTSRGPAASAATAAATALTLTRIDTHGGFRTCQEEGEAFAGEARGDEAKAAAGAVWRGARSRSAISAG